MRKFTPLYLGVLSLGFLWAARAQAPTSLLPNSRAVCSTAQTCIITAASNPTATAQFGSGTTFTTASVPALPLTVAPGVLGADPSPGTGESIYFQRLAAPYTVTYTLAGGNPWVVVIPALTTPVDPCTATNVNWWEIGGGTAGESAALPAATIYKVGAGLCTVASVPITVDLSSSNLAIQQTNVTQQIPVTSNGKTDTVVIPSIAAAKCFVVNSVTFVITPTGGNSATYSSGLVSPVTVCP